MRHGRGSDPTREKSTPQTIQENRPRNKFRKLDPTNNSGKSTPQTIQEHRPHKQIRKIDPATKTQSWTPQQKKHHGPHKFLTPPVDPQKFVGSSLVDCFFVGSLETQHFLDPPSGTLKSCGVLGLFGNPTLFGPPPLAPKSLWGPWKPRKHSRKIDPTNIPGRPTPQTFQENRPRKQFRNIDPTNKSGRSTPQTNPEVNSTTTSGRSTPQTNPEVDSTCKSGESTPHKSGSPPVPDPYVHPCKHLPVSIFVVSILSVGSLPLPCLTEPRGQCPNFCCGVQLWTCVVGSPLWSFYRAQGSIEDWIR